MVQMHQVYFLSKFIEIAHNLTTPLRISRDLQNRMNQNFEV